MLQRPYKQSSNLAAHDSKSRTIQQYEEPVNCRFAGDLDPPTILAEPSPPDFERGRLPTCAKHHSSSTKTLPAPASLQKAKPRPSGTRSSSNEVTTSKPLVFTPAQVYPITTSRSTTAFLARKSASSPLLFDPHAISPPSYSQHSLTQKTFHHMSSDTEDDRDDVGMIYTSPRIGSQTRLSQGLRSRIFRLASTSTPRVRDKPISTTPGVMCAGETETETDEPVSNRILLHPAMTFPLSIFLKCLHKNMLNATLPNSSRAIYPLPASSLPPDLSSLPILSNNG